jgi:hypothetical protein
VVNCPWAFYLNLGKLSQEYCFSTFIFYLKLLDQATKRLAVDYSLGLSIYKLLSASTLCELRYSYGSGHNEASCGLQIRYESP